MWIKNIISTNREQMIFGVLLGILLIVWFKFTIIGIAILLILNLKKFNFNVSLSD